MRSSLLLAALPCLVLAQDRGSEAEKDPYVPHNVSCPQNIHVRAADNLSSVEQDWREARLQRVYDNLADYLKNANIPNFNVSNFTSSLKPQDAPVVGLAISGGGSQSGLGGLGIYQALDSRYGPSVEAGTGGLAQLLTYLTGLSGGALYAVSGLATNNFTTVEEITKTINYTTNYEIGRGGNVTKYYTDLFENAGAKALLGYPVTTADIFGQWWATYMPEKWQFANYSTIADSKSAFSMHDAPMPIMTYAEVVYGESPAIGGIMFPGPNGTNNFNLTSFEINPFEFGSWVGGRVQGFWPTEYLGTNNTAGKPYNDQCVVGFDKMTFVTGTSGWAFNFYLVSDWYNIPLFAKRHLEGRQTSTVNATTGGIQIPPVPDWEENPFFSLLNQTASEFGISWNDALWSTWPNPFNNLASSPEMADTPDLFLVDGSEGGETVPIRPLQIPARGLDFIIAYDSGSDEPTYNYVNGTNLYNSYLSANQSGGQLNFPVIPDVKTLINTNATSRPTFFGCDSGQPDTPLVLYLPNYPWSTYSNFSYAQASFTDIQLNLTLENSFNLATYGNKKLPNNEGADWSACLACAVIHKSLERAGTEEPEACGNCWSKYCWKGETDEKDPAALGAGPTPLLNSSLTYQEWNSSKVWYSEGPGEIFTGGG